MGPNLLGDRYFIQILELEIQSHFELSISAAESQAMAQLVICALSPDTGTEQQTIDNMTVSI